MSGTESAAEPDKLEKPDKLENRAAKEKRAKIGKSNLCPLYGLHHNLQNSQERTNNSQYEGRQNQNNRAGLFLFQEVVH